ncbi:MAG TPA: ammonium transporter [Caulobacteraceae bacterium]|jgi:Amt family ammonium transporter
MLVPSPKWLDTGSNAWQLAAATFVGLQSIPGLVVLYGGLVKKKWALNSAFMALYAFAAVMVVWVLCGYNMAFGNSLFPNLNFIGIPRLALDANFMQQQGNVPGIAAGMPSMAFPMATLMFFQFVFAAITVIILAGSLLGRMSFKAWVLFVPLWMLLDYTVGAFSIWGGGWLSQWGVQDFSGGYVIHLAAGVSGFVAAAIVGPRLQADRDSFEPNSLLLALVGAGILWLGWNGFNGGDPYFANVDAGVAIMNTNLCTCVALLVWVLMDTLFNGKPSVVGAINGMIAGLVGITPGAGFCDGVGAIIIGLVCGLAPWFFMNKIQSTRFFQRVDDTLGVLSTHAVSGVIGGLMVGVVSNPAMLEYIGTDKEAPGVSVTGVLYGPAGWTQLLHQFGAAVFIIAFNAVMTFVILRVIGLFVKLRMDDATLAIGDDAVHGETAYNFEGG